MRRGIAGMVAAAVGFGVTLSACGVAWATNDAKAVPAVPIAAQGDVRPKGDQGLVRPSVKAVPGVRATPFGVVGNSNYVCRADWDDACE